jgi:hypothetical protein
MIEELLRNRGKGKRKYMRRGTEIENKKDVEHAEM